MTEERKAKLMDQIGKLPDFEVAWLWNLCQEELERRDASWPVARSYHAFNSKRAQALGGRIRESAN